MGKEEIISYLKHAKIQNQMLKDICYYFVEDYTASQTAQKLGLSRQTINNYYKIIRTLLLHKLDELTENTTDEFSNNSFSIQYIKTGKQLYYLIKNDNKISFLDFEDEFLPNISNFINTNLTSVILNKKVNSAKVIYNKSTKKYLITKLYKTSNEIQEFVDNRLKKFRGLNKNNLSLHLKESQFRYNYSSLYLYETLLKLLNLNAKASA